MCMEMPFNAEGYTSTISLNPYNESYFTNWESKYNYVGGISCATLTSYVGRNNNVQRHDLFGIFAKIKVQRTM